MLQVCLGEDRTVIEFIEKCRRETTRSVNSLLRDKGFGTVEGHVKTCDPCWKKVTDLILERRAMGSDIDVMVS
jgi:hypothetical protein